MTDYFCKLCEKSIESKKKPLNSQYQQFLTNTIISRYYVSDPNFLDIEDKIRKHIDDYNENFVLYMILCKCKLLFSDLTYIFIFEKMYNVNRFYSLRRYLLTKTESSTRQGH